MDLDAKWEPAEKWRTRTKYDILTNQIKAELYRLPRATFNPELAKTALYMYTNEMIDTFTNVYALSKMHFI